MKKTKTWTALTLLGACMLSLTAGTNGISAHAAPDASKETAAEQFMDCFEPMPIIGGLSSDCWGAAEVGARDQSNGLEDAGMSNYSYWDGGILKDEATGTYYLFASRWNQAGGHWGQDGIDGWQGSQAVYATSDNLYGPYIDQGPLWPDWCDGAGHNVFPFTISESDPLYADGYRYAISISDTGMHGETANGTIHISKSLNGPWILVENGNNGKLNMTGNQGFSLSNVSIMVRPDGRYEATNRNGDLALADSLAGTWEIAESSLWQKIDGMSSDNIEDPVIWYSDGLYRMIVNKWDARTAYYLTSEDGLTNWVRHPGTAYTPDAGFLRYTDGTVNNWNKIERPNVYIEDGKLVAMTFAVIDVSKEADYGNDEHGSKVIVVPFSPEKLTAFDTLPNPLMQRTGILPIADTNTQTWDTEVKKNYGAEPFLQLQKDINYLNHGKGILGEGSRPDEWYDTKIGYLKFDLSETDLFQEGTSAFDESGRAILSLVYLNKPSGDAAETQIQVVLSDASWEEGIGRESVNRNRASGALTWETQPSLSYDMNDLEHTSALSETFGTAAVETEVTIDVTNLVKQFLKEHPDETIISFAMNMTATGTRIRVGSREMGDSFAPKLTIKKDAPEPAPSSTPEPSATPAPTEPVPEPSTTPVPTEPANEPDATPAPTEPAAQSTAPAETDTAFPVWIVAAILLVIALGAAAAVFVQKKRRR